jgi:hypothetical protein
MPKEEATRWLLRRVEARRDYNSDFGRTQQRRFSLVNRIIRACRGEQQTVAQYT